LAWIVESFSWRGGFIALAGFSVLAWLAIFAIVREPASPAAQAPGLREALRGYGGLLRLPHTAGIVALAFVTYAAFISMRGLWLGPMLIDRHGFSLVQSGNVALAVSLIGMLGPALFGRIDPGPARRRRWIVGFTLLVAAGFVLMAALPLAWLDVTVLIAVGLGSGYIVLQYADVRGAYPAAMTGRAMAVFTMAMFLGVAVMQWATGGIASLAHGLGADPYLAVLAAITLLLAAGAAAFRWLPQPGSTPAGEPAQSAR
jgi:predicted MFS family arabinose efflux permease